MVFSKRTSNWRSSFDSSTSASSSSFRDSRLWDIPGSKPIRLFFYSRKRRTIALDPRDVDLFQFTAPPSPISPPPPIPSKSAQPSPVPDHLLKISSEVFLPLDISISGVAGLDDNVSSSIPPTLMTEIPDPENRRLCSKRSLRSPRQFSVSNSSFRGRRVSRRHRQPSAIITSTEKYPDMSESPRPLSCISGFTFVNDHLQELNLSYMDGGETIQINTKRDSVILPAASLDRFLQQTLPAPQKSRVLRPLPIPMTPSNSPRSQIGFRPSLRPLPPLPSTP